MIIISASFLLEPDRLPLSPGLVVVLIVVRDHLRQELVVVHLEVLCLQVVYVLVAAAQHYPLLRILID